MATRLGQVKKTALAAFSNPSSRGIIAMNLPEEDELIAAQLITGDENIVLGTHKGLSIRFSNTDVRQMGRNAYGVHGIRLGKDDYVVGMIAADEEGMILSVTERRIRQADQDCRVPDTESRRQRDHQREDNQTKRQGCCDHAGHG